MAIYELALMGAPSTTQINEINRLVTDAIAPFGLKLGVEVGWTLPSASFTPSDATTSAVAFFGAPGISDTGLPTYPADG